MEGRLLARARARQAEIRSENRALEFRRREEIAERCPEIIEIEKKLRSHMHELVGRALGQPGRSAEELEAESLALQKRRRVLLEKAGFIVNIADVLAVRIDNQPGRLAQVAEILNKEDINVEYVYAFANRHIFLYRVSDTEKAYQKLVSAGFVVLSSQELFNTNK